MPEVSVPFYAGCRMYGVCTGLHWQFVCLSEREGLPVKRGGAEGHLAPAFVCTDRIQLLLAP